MTNRNAGVVDCHCHVAVNWYEPVESLLWQMDQVGVGQATLVQLLGNYDNQYLMDCVRRHEGRFAAIVALDVARVDAVDELVRLHAAGAAGVRLRPMSCSPGADPLAIWRCAAELRLPVSCVGNPASFASAEFAQVLESFPDLPVVLEHMGGTSTADANAELRAARTATWLLARYPQVAMKLPGLGEFMPRAPGAPVTRAPFDLDAAGALIEAALAAFGSQRLLWGSDFPVVSSREGYAHALGWVRECLSAVAPAAVDDVLAGNARRIYPVLGA